MPPSEDLASLAGEIWIDISPEIRTAVRRRLQQERVALMRRADMGSSAALIDEEGDPTDASAQQAIDLERDLEAAHNERTRRLLDDITDALERLDAGTFGICDECADPIEHARLLALPHARRCLRCQHGVERPRR